MTAAPSHPIQSLPSIAGAIKELRLRLGETQLQFAVRTGLALSSLTRYETGAQAPKTSILKALCAIAKEHKYSDLVRVLNGRPENRNRLRSSLRVAGPDGVLDHVGAAGRLIGKACEQIREALTLQGNREGHFSGDFSEQLSVLLIKLSERRNELDKLGDTLQKKTAEARVEGDPISTEQHPPDLNLTTR